jgi:hypothetical protein
MPDDYNDDVGMVKVAEVSPHLGFLPETEKMARITFLYSSLAKWLNTHILIFMIVS